MKIDYIGSREIQICYSSFTAEAAVELISKYDRPTELWVYFVPMKLDGRIAKLKRRALAIASKDGIRLAGKYTVDIGDRFGDLHELWGMLCYDESTDEILCGIRIPKTRYVDGIDTEAFHPDARLGFTVAPPIHFIHV